MPEKIQSDPKKTKKAIYKESRNKFTVEKGLPRTATEEDINRHIYEELRKKLVAEKKLPLDATFEDIYKSDSERSLQKFITKKGLPPNTTWEDIENNDYQEFRKKFATKKEAKNIIAPCGAMGSCEQERQPLNTHKYILIGQLTQAKLWDAVLP